MFVGPAHRDPSTRKRDGLSLHLARWAGLALPGQNSDFSEIDYDPVRPIPSLALLRCVFIGDGTMHSNMKEVRIWDRACDRATDLHSSAWILSRHIGQILIF